MPLISVLLPVYNAEKTLNETINSILSQTFTDFEFIIINDASTDHSEEIILNYKDFRIRYFKNFVNKGLVYTLNRGIDLACGKYIARMDADDISLPTRFQKQIDVMENHSEVIVCGTWIKPFGEGCTNIRFQLKEYSAEMKEQLVRDSCFAHPTVMIRRSILIEYSLRYNERYRHAEDYKLWTDMASYGEFYNVPEELLYYRISPSQVTSFFKMEIVEVVKTLRRENIALRFKDVCLNRDLAEERIKVGTICQAKKYNSKFLLATLYLSLSNYGLKELLYFVVSLDCFKLDLIITLAIFKRFVKGSNSLV